MSRAESLASADFRDLDAREHLLEIEALMRRFARRLKHRLRRQAHLLHDRRLAMPATIRRSVESGGTPLAPALAGAPAGAAAAGAAAGREPLDGRLQLLLPAARACACRRTGRCAQLHLPHAHHPGVRGAARSRSLARPGAPAPAGAGLGRRHPHRRDLAQFNREHAPRLVHSRHRRPGAERRLRHRLSAQLGQALAQLRRRAAASSGSTPVRPARLRAGQPGHAGGAAAPGPAGARRPAWRRSPRSCPRSWRH